MSLLPMKDLILQAQSRYTGTFKEDETFDAIVKTLVGYIAESQDQEFTIIDQAFNIDKSSGNMLDIIGKIVNQSRVLVSYNTEMKFGFFGHPLSKSFGTLADPSVGGYWDSVTNSTQKFRVMDDETYRKVLRARIASNTSGASINGILSVINILTDTNNARVDNNASGDAVLVVSDLGSGNLELLQYFYTRIGSEDSILPIPLGVNLQVEVI